MSRLLALGLLLWGLAILLSGCVAITFGRVSLDHGAAHAVRFVSLGAWSACGAVGVGVVSGTCVSARPGESVALVGAKLIHLPQTRNLPYANEAPLRSAGGDR